MFWILLIAVLGGLIWFLRGWWNWRLKQAGDDNELDWLDEVVSEHLAGKYDHTETIRRSIQDIERTHTPSQTLHRELRRAREALETKKN